MMVGPRVSVVMAVLDPDPVYFREAVRSVLNQDFRDLELLIIEEPGVREAAEILSQFHDSRIRHWRHAERTSLVEQRNRGLALATCELVALLDADDVCMPDRITKQYEYMQRHGYISVLGSQLAIIDAEGKQLGYRRYPTDDEAIRRSFPRFNPIAQPSVMLRKSVVLDAGGYQYVRHPATEDYELWSRLAVSGTRFANHPEALVRYRIHAEAAKSSKLRGILRGTLDIKRMYWSGGMDAHAVLRMTLERVLLWLPVSWVMRLFYLTQISRVAPAPLSDASPINDRHSLK